MKINSLRLLILSLFALAAFPVAAAGARSPEALAMAFVQAFRGGQVEHLVALHYYPGGQTDPARDRGAWRSLVKEYRLSGYRVANLDGTDRARLARQQPRPILAPVKKFVAQLVSTHGGRQLVLERYIAAANGRFYFLVPAAR
jgi:hypothetical protein